LLIAVPRKFRDNKKSNMKKSLQTYIESAIVYLVENPLLFRYKKTQPSLLALNVSWFTNCGWIEQLTAFKQIDIYYTFKY